MRERKGKEEKRKTVKHIMAMNESREARDACDRSFFFSFFFFFRSFLFCENIINYLKEKK